MLKKRKTVPKNIKFARDLFLEILTSKKRRNPFTIGINPLSAREKLQHLSVKN